MAKKGKLLVDQELCDRFILVVKHYGKSYEAFCAEFGFASTTVSDIKKHRREPSREILDRIVAKREFSEAWLRRGEGPPMMNDVAAESAMEYVLDGAALTEAGKLVDEIVIQGRPFEEADRNELISLIAEEIAELRALGRPGEIRRKIRRWIQVADRLAGSKLKK